MKWFIGFAVLIAVAMVGIVVSHHARSGDTVGGSSLGSHSSGAKIATISNGETVAIADHLGARGFTVVEFTAAF